MILMMVDDKSGTEIPIASLRMGAVGSREK
jgi:hypothetical protein